MINKNEVKRLLRSIESNLTKANADIILCLKKTEQVARVLGDDEMMTWAERELNGYDNVDDLPFYRYFVGYWDDNKGLSNDDTIFFLTPMPKEVVQLKKFLSVPREDFRSCLNYIFNFNNVLYQDHEIDFPWIFGILQTPMLIKNRLSLEKYQTIRITVNPHPDSSHKNDFVICEDTYGRYVQAMTYSIIHKISEYINEKLFTDKITDRFFIEQDIENYIVDHWNDIFPTLTYRDRQHTVDGGIIDILARDEDGVNVIIELKKEQLSRANVGQLLHYISNVKNSRGILVVESVPEKYVNLVIYLEKQAVTVMTYDHWFEFRIALKRVSS